MKTRFCAVFTATILLGATATTGYAVLLRLPAHSARARIYRNLSYVPNGRLRQKLDLYLPQGASRPPLIVMVHGGGFLFGDKSQEDVGKYLRAGFAVASINYRLSNEAHFPAQIEDCKAAVRWLRAHAARFGFNPKWIGAVGESAGGTLAALLGTTGTIKGFDVGPYGSVSSKVQAVADFFGPTDFLRMDAERLPDGDLHNDPESPESQLIGGAIQRNQAKAERANPITYITPKTPPFFIAHGDADRQVPYGQSILLRSALKKAGVPVTLYIQHGARHGFQSATVDKMVLGFFARYLGPAKGKP